MVKRWTRSNATTDSPPDRPPSAPSAGPPLPLRRLLRALAGTELWHIEEPRTRAQRIPTMLYLVKRGGREATFNRPHEAWSYFQELTDAPDSDTRPQPPPLDDVLLRRHPRPLRRRRRAKPASPE